jgi:hypothetical protein
MFKKLIIYSLGFLALNSLVGCSLLEMWLPLAYKAEPLKILSLSEDVCDPPCWMGIFPDETSFTDALKIVKELEFFSQNGDLIVEANKIILIPTYAEIVVDDNKEFILWQSGVEQNAHIAFENGIVSLISFYIPETKLGNVIEKYGTPDSYYTYSVENVVEGETEKYFGMDIFYPETGLVFGVVGREPISDDSVVLNVTFTHPGTVEEIVAEYLSPGLPGQNVIVRLEYFPWEGYGVCPQGLPRDVYCEE